METNKNSELDFSKIDIIDMCNFLNDRADLIKSPSSFMNLEPYDISKIAMCDYIKIKTDNFDKYKFDLLIEDIRLFPPNFDKTVVVNNEKVYIENVTGYDLEWDPGMKLHEYIHKIEELNDGLFVSCMRILDFSEVAENLYQKICEQEPEQKQIQSKTYQLQTNLTDTQRGKLFDLLVSNKFIPNKDKAGFIWAFGGEQMQPSNWQPIDWIDKSVTRKEPNIQTLYELLYLLGVNKDTSANNPNNLYSKINYCFSGFNNIQSKNPYKIQQDTKRKKLLKTILEDV